MLSKTHFRKSTLRSAVLLALSLQGTTMILGASDAQADQQACAATNASPPYTDTSTDSGNFTMLDPSGYVVGGTNDVVMSWDGTAFTSSSDYAGPGSTANVTAASTAPFFSNPWTAHDIQVFAPGSYSFDTATGGGNPESGTLSMTVGAGQIGMHMLFDWNGNFNIDVVVVADRGTVFGAGIGLGANPGCASTAPASSLINCLFDQPLYGTDGMPVASSPWMLTSSDQAAGGDGIPGTPMASGGPFQFFNANFNFNFPSAVVLTSGTVCNPLAQPDPFDFDDVTGVAPGTYESANTITVSGLGGASVPVTISVGQYSKNSGSYTSADGTAVDGDTFKVQQTTGSAEDGTKTDATLSIGVVNGTFSVTVIDKKPAAFSFTDQTGVATSTPIESDAIIVTLMDAGQTTPINITGGEYSKNGGAYTNVTGTVTNNDTVKVRQTSSANAATTTDAILTLGSALNGTVVSDTFSVRTLGGLATSSNNFTMLDKTGLVTGGTNDVEMDWDQQYNTDENDSVSSTTTHMHLSSVNAFFQYTWTAHHIRVFGPGTYTIDTTCTTADLEAGTAVCNHPLESDQTRQFYTFTVGANQIGAHMLFDWNVAKNIDVVNVWNQSAVFGSSQLFTGPKGCANSAQVWDYMSTDWDNDGENGSKMIDGPFKGFSANFNLRTTTVALECSDYTATVNVSDPSKAGGCSISQKPVSALERADWWLVAGFLAWLGGIRIRLQRRRINS